MNKLLLFSILGLAAANIVTGVSSKQKTTPTIGLQQVSALKTPTAQEIQKSLGRFIFFELAPSTPGPSTEALSFLANAETAGTYSFECTPFARSASGKFLWKDNGFLREFSLPVGTSPISILLPAGIKTTTHAISCSVSLALDEPHTLVSAQQTQQMAPAGQEDNQMVAAPENLPLLTGQNEQKGFVFSFIYDKTTPQ